MSYYGYERICAFLEVTPAMYPGARDALIDMDLIAFDGTRFQVLSLPPYPRRRPAKPLTSARDLEDEDPATIRGLI